MVAALQVLDTEQALEDWIYTIGRWGFADGQTGYSEVCAAEALC